MKRVLLAGYAGLMRAYDEVLHRSSPGLQTDVAGDYPTAVSMIGRGHTFYVVDLTIPDEVGKVTGSHGRDLLEKIRRTEVGLENIFVLAFTEEEIRYAKALGVGRVYDKVDGHHVDQPHPTASTISDGAGKRTEGKSEEVLTWTLTIEELLDRFGEMLRRDRADRVGEVGDPYKLPEDLLAQI